MADETITTPTDNGPYHIRGRFRVVLPSGRELETQDEAWLCRCGRSQTKPFCDGTHSRLGFAAAEAAVARADEAQAQGHAHDQGEAVAVAQAGNEDGFVAVAGADDVPEGEILGVEVAGRLVVLGRVDGKVHAIGGICSHLYARLEDGALDGEVVMCPLHNSGFNIKTGAAVRLPAQAPVPTYAVRLDGDTILVSTAPTPVEAD